MLRIKDRTNELSVKPASFLTPGSDCSVVLGVDAFALGASGFLVSGFLEASLLNMYDASIPAYIGVVIESDLIFPLEKACARVPAIPAPATPEDKDLM